MKRVSGKMLFCGPDTDAPPIVLRPEAKGWHAIYVGTYSGTGFPFFSDNTVLFLKLTGDPAYSRATLENFRPGKDIVPSEMLSGASDLREAYWKSAYLTGQEIVFHRPEAGLYAGMMTSVCYVRLVPLSGAEAARAEKDRTRKDTRRLIANHDSGQHTEWGYASRQEMLNEFEGLRNSDFKMILWGCALGLGTYYPSRVATEQIWTPGFGGYQALGNETRDRYRRAGFDTLEAAVSCA